MNSNLKHKQHSNKQHSNKQQWAIILAGGDGQRLQEVTRRISGDDRPKQFCPLLPGGATLLQQTRARIAQVVPASRTIFIFNREHERFYADEYSRVPQERMAAQPHNHGTLAAILYGLILAARKDPDSVVGVFPSDHYYARESRFTLAVQMAYEVAVADPLRVVLLGAEARAPEPGYGYIEPDVSQDPASNFGPFGMTPVRRFWEKPGQWLAEVLIKRGCLWNTFVMMGRVASFLNLIREAAPIAYAAFEPLLADRNLRIDADSIYGKIPALDFSSSVLVKSPAHLSVLSLGRTGWSDLGEPHRLLALFEPQELGLDSFALPIYAHAG
jgi:mannose-1-phosphate guanylyltransferase